MPEKLTAAEIAAWTRIEKAATPVPWSYSLRRRVFEHPDSSDRVFTADGKIPNIILALTARNALPRLLAERAEMEGAIDWLQNAIATLWPFIKECTLVPGNEDCRLAWFALEEAAATVKEARKAATAGGEK